MPVDHEDRYTTRRLTIFLSLVVLAFLIVLYILLLRYPKDPTATFVLAVIPSAIPVVVAVPVVYILFGTFPPAMQVSEDRDIDAIIIELRERLEKGIASTLEMAQQTLEKRIEAELDRQLPGSGDHALLERLKAGVRDDLEEGFQTIQLETEALAHTTQPVV